MLIHLLNQTQNCPNDLQYYSHSNATKILHTLLARGPINVQISPTNMFCSEIKIPAIYCWLLLYRWIPVFQELPVEKLSTSMRGIMRL